MIVEDCPLCLCSGTKSKREGIFKPGRTFATACLSGVSC
jgi:hypothetical protein